MHSWLSAGTPLLLAASVALASGCGGEASNSQASAGSAGSAGRPTNVGGAGHGADGAPGGAGKGPSSVAGSGGNDATGGDDATGGMLALGGAPAGAAGEPSNEDRYVCSAGPAQGKTCDDYCSAYRDKCGAGTGYGAYQKAAPSDDPTAGRAECIADCRRFSLIYDDDLCCRLTEVAQAVGPQDQHCDSSVFFWGGVCGNGNVRDSKCATGAQSGKTCKDFCDAYSEETKCSGVGYLGWDDCYFSCKTDVIVQQNLCCRLAEVAQASGPEDPHCANAHVYAGGICDTP